MEEKLEKYRLAAACLPGRLQRLAFTLEPAQQALAEEFRLRAGLPMTVLLPSGESEPWGEAGLVQCEDLELCINMVTEFSRYAATESLRSGYLSAKGGCRLGVCGTAVMKNGANTNLRELSSVAIRIAREVSGIAEPLASQLFLRGQFCSTLVLSPPGGGKTTLLRDLVRSLSDGGENHPPLRMALIDERGELAVLYQGLPQMDVGRHTDVLDACPKAVGVPMLLRAMNPQVIAVDEITVEADIEAMTAAANCGVGLLATIHGSDLTELLQKPLYAKLLAANVFRKAILIERDEEGRHYQLLDLPC